MVIKRSVREINKSEYISCACGCGQRLTRYYGGSKGWYERKYINGHNTGDQTLSNNRNWKGGHMDSGGYKRIGRKHRYHRYVYEQYHKCCLLPWIDIHHKDGNKLNNDITNLEPLLHSKHISLTRSKPEIFDRKCIVCGQGSYIQKRSGRPTWTKYGNGFRCMKCYQKEYWRAHN